MEAGGGGKSLSPSNLPFITSPVLMLSRFKLNYKGEISLDVFLGGCAG